MDENSNKKQEEMKKECRDQLNKEEFLRTLLLVTNEKALELQNKRTERKRRSTANPNYNNMNSSTCTNPEQPTVSVY